MVVVTNDIYTTEDADFLRHNGVLADDRIRAVRHRLLPRTTAIRDDITRETWTRSRTWNGGTIRTWSWSRAAATNLTATFSYGLIDRQIFVVGRGRRRQGATQGRPPA